MARGIHWILRSLLAGACFLAGCGYVRTMAARGLMEDVSQATLQHEDIDLVSQALPTYLLLLEGLIEGDPENAELLLAATEGYTSYALLVEAGDASRAAALYSRAMQYGRRTLIARRPATGELIDGPFSGFGEITNDLRQADLPYVFWAASAWGAWIGAHLSDMEALADLPRVIHLMRWVLDTDEDFRNGNPHVFLGVYHAALPPALGGDPEQALFHFERALAITADHDLMVRVQMARFYARQIFDRELYVRLLEQVIASPLDTVPELTLQNAIARRLAHRLLADVDVYF